MQPDKLADKSYDEIVKILKDHYNPKPSPIIQYFKFNSRDRLSRESIAAYVAALRALGEHCQFGARLDEMLRDRLVCGVQDSAIQRRLLQEPELTYKSEYDLAIAMEAATRDAHDLKKPVAATTHSVQQVLKTPKAMFVCNRCGGKGHTSNFCRFREASCRACGKKEHLARVCRSKGKQTRSQGQAPNPPKAHTLDKVSLPPSIDVEVQPSAVYTVRHRSPPIETKVWVKNHIITMKVDTGAALSLISEDTYSSNYNSFPLQPTETQLRTYNEELLPVLGSLEVTVAYNGQQAVLPLLVVKGSGPNLLGRDWLSVIRMDWNVICQVERTSPITQLLEKHSRVFRQEVGLWKDAKAKINIHEGANPKFFKPRSISYYLKGKVETEITRLMKEGVISLVTYSDWVAPIVPVIKSDGNVRLCGDYKVTVNPVAKQDTYPLPKINDLFTAVSGGRIFSSRLPAVRAGRRFEAPDNCEHTQGFVSV